MFVICRFGTDSSTSETVKHALPKLLPQMLPLPRRLPRGTLRNETPLQHRQCETLLLRPPLPILKNNLMKVGLLFS